MEKTVTCLLHAPTDERGNLYKTAMSKLEDLTAAIRPFVTASTSWVHDGARPAINTILLMAPQFDLRISRQQLEEDMADEESTADERRKMQQVSWLPSLDPVEGVQPWELQAARDEIFAKLEQQGSVLACMREQYFRSLFGLLGGTPYAGPLSGGDAIVLQFAGEGRSLVLTDSKRLTTARA